MAVTRRRWTSLLIACSAASMVSLSCDDPYDGWGDPEGEFYAGPVDPINFPPEYLGIGGNRFAQGGGTFIASPALVAGQPVEYFLFPFTGAQLRLDNPLLLLSNGTPPRTVPIGLAYVFDPREQSPFPAEQRCASEEGYVYDRYNDVVPYDQQGNIFTVIPNVRYTPGAEVVNTYVPIVREVPVTSNGLPCQSAKSVDNLLVRNDVSFETVDLPGGKKEGKHDGKFLAWAVIDPGAAVYGANDPGAAARLDREIPTVENSGSTLQKWGWYDHYLLAYLDGGYIPTAAGTNAEGQPTVTAVTQRLYIPRSEVTSGGEAVDVEVGGGYDVLQFRRGEPGYSPICEVFTYDIGAPTDEAALPTSAADIEATYGTTIEAAGTPYVYCLQVQ